MISKVYHLASVAVKVGEWLMALPGCGTIFSLLGVHIMPPGGQDRSYFSPGMLEELIEELRELIMEFPEDEKLLLDLASAYYNIGQYQEAVELFQGLLVVTPEDLAVHNNLGTAYRTWALKERAEGLSPEDVKDLLFHAVEEYRYVLDNGGERFPDTHKNLGDVYRELNNSKRAAEHYLRALEINPRYSAAAYQLALVNEKAGDLEGAIGLLKLIIETHLKLTEDVFDPATIHYNLGRIYNKKGYLEEAIRHYRSVISAHPDYADVHFHLGLAYKTRGEYKLALNCFEQALRVNPEYKEARIRYWECAELASGSPPGKQ